MEEITITLSGRSFYLRFLNMTKLPLEYSKYN